MAKIGPLRNSRSQIKDIRHHATMFHDAKQNFTIRNRQLTQNKNLGRLEAISDDDIDEHSGIEVFSILNNNGFIFRDTNWEWKETYYILFYERIWIWCAFLATFHQITFSIRTLKNRLRQYQLQRRTPSYDLLLVRDTILRELSGQFWLQWRRSIWYTLRL